MAVKKPTKEKVLRSRTKRYLHGRGDWLYILNDAGEPVPEPDVLKWARWLGSNDAARVIAEDSLPGGVMVSTIFMGQNRPSFSSGPRLPILWETMIFGGEHDLYQRRYTSRAAAEVGHRTAVILAKGSK